MYKVIIELNRNITDEELKTLTETINKTFDNRAGCVKNTSTEKYHFLFEGEEDKFGCMQLALVTLKRIKLFWDNVIVWEWIDEEFPEENCNVIEEFSTPVR